MLIFLFVASFCVCMDFCQSFFILLIVSYLGNKCTPVVRNILICVLVVDALDTHIPSGVLMYKYQIHFMIICTILNYHYSV